MHANCSYEKVQKVASAEQVEELEKLRENELPLCNTHYRAALRSIAPVTQCFVCGKVEAKAGSFRRASNAQLLQLGTKSDASQADLRSARLCSSCRWLEQQDGPSDSVFESFSKKFLLEAASIEPPYTDASVIEKSKALTVAHVVQKLCQNEAILLADVHEHFNKLLMQHGRPPYQKSSSCAQFIEKALGHNVSITFIKGARRAGYLVHRPGGDLQHAVYCALSDLRQSTKDAEISLSDLGNAKDNPASSIEQDTVDNVTMLKMNDLLHNQAREWSKQGAEPKAVANVNIDKVLTQTDSRLWQMIWTLTTSKSHRQQCKEEAEAVQKGETISRRKLPCLFLLSAMAHLVFPACHYPFQLVLADYIDSHSGSSELLQVLARLGVCSSRDTHQRHKTAVVTKRYQSGVQDELSQGAFSVTSIDNIDRNAPGKRISTADQNRGFHGTSVQHCNPMPLTCQTAEEEVPATPAASAALPGLFSYSFDREKHSTRPRTLQEGAPKQNAQQPPPPIATCAEPSNVTLPAPEVDLPADRHEQFRLQWYRPPHVALRPLSLDAVRLSTAEATEVQSMESAIHEYMVRRFSTPGETMPGLKQHLALKMHSVRERSLVTTLGILPDSVDQLDTVKAVLDSLQSFYAIGCQRKWHLVVGDQKVFSYMHQLKRQYGAELDWLKPFPGDWHLLKNFQPVLMKVYFHCGLKDLAVQAGYKGSNLTALESCGSFKQTHIFLLEVFEAMYQHALSVMQTKGYDPTAPLSDFTAFLGQLSASPTAKLWVNFLTRNLRSYIHLWLAIRTSNWPVCLG